MEPPKTLHLCRDPKDNHILEAAIEGKADFIISRDDDLKGDPGLVTHMKRLGVQVMTVSGFLKMLNLPAA